MPNDEPLRFGPYILDERIAEGGMAEVFRARRVGVAGFSRRVCIKRILPALAVDPEFIGMFIDEARTGSALRHGNIVAVDDFGDVNGRFFLAMEWIAGVDVAHLLEPLGLAGERMPLDAVVQIAADALRALDYAHRKLDARGAALGIVHRDVSPQNLLVSVAGEVKLTDFGIAKAATRLQHTGARSLKGKLAYMAPEQARGEPLDGRADLFSLGVVLYELLAGKRPFYGPTESAQILALLTGAHTPLAELRADVPRALTTLVEEMLAMDPTNRPADAYAALERLQPLADGLDGARTLATLVARFYPELPRGPSASQDRVPTERITDDADTEVEEHSPSGDIVRTRATPPEALEVDRSASTAVRTRTTLPARAPRRARRSRTWIAIGLAVASSGIIVALWRFVR